MCRLRRAQYGDSSILLKKLLAFIFLWITLVIGTVVGEREVCLSPCIANALLELGLGWKEAPVQICLGDSKNIEVVFGKKGAKEMFLGCNGNCGRPPRFWNPRRRVSSVLRPGRGAHEPLFAVLGSIVAEERLVGWRIGALGFELVILLDQTRGSD
jgi:hypothetical protein